MSRPAQYGDRVNKSLLLSRDLDARLKAEAQRRCVSVNLLIERAVETYLSQLDEP